MPTGFVISVGFIFSTHPFRRKQQNMFEFCVWRKTERAGGFDVGGIGVEKMATGLHVED